MTFYIALLISLALLASGCCQSNSALRDEGARLEDTHEVTKKAVQSIVAEATVEKNENIENLFQQKFKLLNYSRPSVAEGAIPISLASSDINDDGAPDIIAGYGVSDRGWLIVQHGSSKASDDEPISESGNAFQVPLTPDLIVSGDFDNDRSDDLAVAARGGNRICWLKGNGRGEFTLTQEFTMPASITTLFAADTNRHDGRINLIAGGAGVEGWKVMVIEGTGGSFSGQHEIFSLPSEPIAFDAADFDRDYWIDLVVAMKDGIEVIYGRDRKRFSENSTAQDRTQHISLRFGIKSIAKGRFTSENIPGLAVLASNGKIYSLAPEKAKKKKIKWKRRSVARDSWPDASFLLAARISGNALNDLILVDQNNFKIELVSPRNDTNIYRLHTSFNQTSKPIAVLPLRFNKDALSDLVILDDSPLHTFSLLLTQPQATFVVNLTTDEADADPGDGVCDVDPGTAGHQCTLRAAIEQANSSPGTDEITFSGVSLVGPLNPLPLISEPVSIHSGTPGQRVELSGSSLVLPSYGLQFTGGSSTITDLVINGFDIAPGGCGIGLEVNGNNVIDNTFIGTDFTGSEPLSNRIGICIFNSPDNEILSSVISGNIGAGIDLSGATSARTQIHNSFVGTDITGTQALGNGLTGIDTGNDAEISNTVISANGGLGLLIANGTSVQNCRIGTDTTGTLALGNAAAGISIAGSANTIATSVISANLSGVQISGPNSTNVLLNNVIGTQAGGAGSLGNADDGIFIGNSSDNEITSNTIAHNAVQSGAGIRILGDPSIDNRISMNVIHSNNALGIDLNGDGVTANDTDDADSGPNQMQNFPQLTSVSSQSGVTNIQGVFDSDPANSTYPIIIEFFSNTVCDPSNFGEGETLIGSHTMIGPGGFSIDVSGEHTNITAVAIDTNGNSSEFSECFAAGSTPNFQLTITPAFAKRSPGSMHVVQASILLNGVPVPDILIDFMVTGSNAGVSGTCFPANCTTDQNGHVFFVYNSSVPGYAGDAISASATIQTITLQKVAYVKWNTYCSTDVPIVVAPGESAQSVLNISDNFTIGDVNVRLYSEGPAELNLRHPSATSETVPLESGGTSCSGSLVFAGPDHLIDSELIWPPPLSPESQNLLVFNGLNSTGDWFLSITNNGTDPATIHCWCLELSEEGPPCILDPGIISVPDYTSVTEKVAVSDENGNPISGASAIFWGQWGGNGTPFTETLLTDQFGIASRIFRGEPGENAIFYTLTENEKSTSRCSARIDWECDVTPGSAILYGTAWEKYVALAPVFQSAILAGEYSSLQQKVTVLFDQWNGKNEVCVSESDVAEFEKAIESLLLNTPEYRELLLQLKDEIQNRDALAELGITIGCESKEGGER
jgi:CSLREA domain-containing protein